MQVVIAVIDELYAFALSVVLLPFRSLDKTNSAASVPKEEPVATSTNIELSPEVAEEVQRPAFKRVDEVIAKENGLEAVLGGGKNTVMYAGTTEVPICMNPTLGFDSLVSTLTYGDMVMVLEQRGRWAKVIHGEDQGWVLREDLVDRAAHVYPKFTIGEKNAADDPNTIRIRAIIEDMFGGGKAELPLQAGEYVMYRLHRKGLTVDWPKTRPRTPGAWHAILKGVTGIHVGVAPKTGAIMEYMLTEEMGHLAYVDAVFPDETINISEVNFPEDGIYNERVMTEEEWKGLKPVFIQVV